MHKILAKIKSDLLRTGRPHAVVDIASHGVLAASCHSFGQAHEYAFHALPPRAVVPGVGENNVRLREPVIDAVRATLERVHPESRAVTIVVPDMTARVFVLTFDSMPERVGDALAVIRFRLRKLVPFNVENAQISFQALPSQEQRARVLAVAIAESVLAEYEDAVSAAGYEPGAVLPYGVAALGALDSAGPVLAVSLSEVSLTTSICYANDLLLYRARELPEDLGLRSREIENDIAVAIAYFEDKLAHRPQCLRYSGTRTTTEFARCVALSDLPVVDVVPRPRDTNFDPSDNISFAGVAGALAGVR